MRRLLLGLVLAGCATAPPASWKAEPSPRLDDRFFPDGSPWRGGDAVYSVPLSNDRVLWLFGDSFIAKPNATGREGSKMVRNSLAIETAGGSLDFYWRTENGQPADALKCPVEGEWLWPLSGLRIGHRLHLFLNRVQAKGDGAFGFKVRETLLASIENPDDAPDRWKMILRHSPDTFGTASLCLDGFAYLFGIRENRASPLQLRDAIVARVPASEIDVFGRWGFWTGEGWSDTHAGSPALFSGAATEMSVSFLTSAGRLAAVTSAPFLSPAIQIRQAPRPEGPWSDPVTVFTCPEPGWKKGYFCYAAKAHPELDPSGRTLVISYACNSTSFADAVHDLRIYRPRFVVARLE